MPQLAAIALYANDLAATAAFYAALGIALEPEQHKGGLPHAVGRLDGAHFAIHQAADGPRTPAPAWRSRGSDFFGCYVDDLDGVVETLTHAGASVLADHQVRTWGCRLVLEDPDGRPVEVNQRGHCPQVEGSR